MYNFVHVVVCRLAAGSRIVCRGVCVWAGCEAGVHENRLINDLLNHRNHSPYERPVANESATLEVRFQISLQQIIDVVYIFCL